MKSLYMYFLGGTAKGANIEVHDVQFAIVNDPADAHEQLAQLWFGEPDLLHVDVETRINWADGHDVIISTEPDIYENKLYFVNMGGYIHGDVDEKHTFDLIVARSEKDAKERAKILFKAGDVLIHKDQLCDVDRCIILLSIEDNYIHLKPNPNGARDIPEYRYIPIGENIVKLGVDGEILTH